jgi:alternate signal-mediated exported protein
VCGPTAPTHDWQYDNGDAFTPATSKVVPGDKVTKVCDITLTLVGSHIGASLDVVAGGFTGAANGLTDELLPTAAFTVEGVAYDFAVDGPYPFDHPGTYHVLVDIGVDFPFGVEDNDSNVPGGLQAVLDGIVVTATQTHDTAS